MTSDLVSHLRNFSELPSVKKLRSGLNTEYVDDKKKHDPRIIAHFFESYRGPSPIKCGTVLHTPNKSFYANKVLDKKRTMNNLMLDRVQTTGSP